MSNINPFGHWRWRSEFVRPRRLPLPFWLVWTGAIGLCGLSYGLLQGSLFADSDRGLVALVGPLLGAPIVGFLQGLAIRSRLGRGQDWAIATTIGTALGLAIGGLALLGSVTVMIRFPASSLGWLVLPLTIGAAVQGACQAWILRSRVRRPAIWIGICTLAWTINAPFLVVWGAMTLFLASQAMPLFWALNGLLSGLLVGVIQGIGLSLWLPSTGRSESARSRLKNRDRG